MRTNLLRLLLLLSCPSWPAAAEEPPYQVTWNFMFSDAKGVLRAMGEGRALAAPDRVVTGGKLAAIATDSLTIGAHTLRITDATKLCNVNGKRESIQTFKPGDSVLATSKPGGSDALTIRKGMLERIMSDAGAGDTLVKNYTCS